jgi:hypothetical protein
MPTGAATAFDDRAADRQPHANSVGFSREEGIEDAVHFRWIKAGTGILDSNQHVPVAIHLGA